MTDRAPERIWVCVREDSGGEWQPAWPMITGFHMEVPGSTEYLRADLVPPPPALSGEAEEVVAETRKAATCVYIAVEKIVADDLSRILSRNASLIERQAREIASIRESTRKRMEANSDVMKTGRAENERLSRELAEARAALKQLVADYGDVPDPTDKDGQSVMARARLASRNPADGERR